MSMSPDDANLGCTQRMELLLKIHRHRNEYTLSLAYSLIFCFPEETSLNFENKQYIV